MLGIKWHRLQPARRHRLKPVPLILNHFFLRGAPVFPIPEVFFVPSCLGGRLADLAARGQRCIAWKMNGPASAITSPTISDSGLDGIASLSVRLVITAR
jgi:hypothetical protein